MIMKEVLPKNNLNKSFIAGNIKSVGHYILNSKGNVTMNNLVLVKYFIK